MNNQAKNRKNRKIDLELIPHDKDLEIAILGTLLLEPSKINEVIFLITSKNFFFKFHQDIFGIIINLTNKGKTADFALILTELKEIRQNQGTTPEIAELAALMDGGLKLTNIKQLAQKLVELADRRSMIFAAKNIFYSAQENMDSFELINTARNEIDKIAIREESKDFTNIFSMLQGKLNQIEAIANSNEPLSGVLTGFSELDRVLLGLQANQLVVIAARPGVGKTSFAMQVAQNAAQAGKKIGFFSLEMSKDQLCTRLLSNIAEVDSYIIRDPKRACNYSIWKKLFDASQQTQNLQIFIDDTASQKISSIKAKCRRLKAEKGLDLVIVDYLQLVKPGSTKTNREQEVSEISRGLKELAKELDIPVIALAQLNRGTEQRSEHRPMLSDLRESGAVEQDGDIVIFLYREEMYSKNPGEEIQGVCEVIVAKNRVGATDTVKLAFIKQFTKFANLYQEVRSYV